MTKRPTDDKIERQLAETQQREGEGMPDFAVRMMEMDRREKKRRKLPVISEKSFVRKCSKLRKDLERKQGALRKGSEPPINVEDPAFVEHMRKIQEKREKDFQMGPMRSMASAFATKERAARDPEYKEDVERHGHHSRAVKPWKGRAGRDARSRGKLTKREHAIELRKQGRTEAAIGKIIDRDPRTVRRYLTGR